MQQLGEAKGGGWHFWCPFCGTIEFLGPKRDNANIEAPTLMCELVLLARKNRISVSVLDGQTHLSEFVDGIQPETRFVHMIDAIVARTLADAEKRLRAELALTPVWQIVAEYRAVRRAEK
jgi:hypothetical protein